MKDLPSDDALNSKAANTAPPNVVEKPKHLQQFDANIVVPSNSQAIQTGVYEEGSVVISGNHFGSIYTTFNTIDQHVIAHENAGLEIGHIRWPGGGQAEAEAVYSLVSDNISAKQNKGLSDVLALANELDVPFSMIIPSKRYLDDFAQGQEDLKTFLTKLLAGDFGPLPDDFTLEIGNESFVAKGAITGNRYWDLAESMLTTIRETLSDPLLNSNGIDFNITVLSGNGKFVTNHMLETISPENLAIIDSIVSHHLESSIDQFGFDDIKLVDDLWSNAFKELGIDSPELNFSAWNLGKPVDNFELHKIDPNNGVDVSGIDVAELLKNEIGARQAAGTISAFSQLIAYGADYLTVWGNVKHENSYLWHTDLGGLEALSHGGEVLRLVNESLIGTHLLDGTIVDGQWSQDHTTVNYDSFAYEDGAKMVLFLAASDIGDEGLEVTIDLSQLDGVVYVWAEVVRTTVPDEFAEFIGTDYERLFEVPVVTRFAIELNVDTFTYTLEQDYEVVRFIIAGEEPGDGYLHLWGENSDDIFTGGPNGDFLEGNGGNDTLIGNGGDDTLTGGNGADVLNGGMGNNILTGGSGADVFEFTESSANDAITDFNADEDVIDLSALTLEAFSVFLSVNGASGKYIEQAHSNIQFYENSLLNIEVVQIGDGTVVSIESSILGMPNSGYEFAITLEDFTATDLTMDDFNFI